MIFLHVPTVLWAASVEFAAWPCPLTPIEKWLRTMAQEHAYEGGFIEHYLLPIIYVDEMTRNVQIALAASVLLGYVAVYVWLWRRHSNSR